MQIQDRVETVESWLLKLWARDNKTKLRDSVKVRKKAMQNWKVRSTSLKSTQTLKKRLISYTWAQQQLNSAAYARFSVNWHGPSLVPSAPLIRPAKPRLFENNLKKLFESYQFWFRIKSPLWFLRNRISLISKKKFRLFRRARWNARAWSWCGRIRFNWALANKARAVIRKERRNYRMLRIPLSKRRRYLRILLVLLKRITLQERKRTRQRVRQVKGFAAGVKRWGVYLHRQTTMAIKIMYKRLYKYYGVFSHMSNAYNVTEKYCNKNTFAVANLAPALSKLRRWRLHQARYKRRLRTIAKFPRRLCVFNSLFYPTTNTFEQNWARKRSVAAYQFKKERLAEYVYQTKPPHEFKNKDNGVLNLDLGRVVDWYKSKFHMRKLAALQNYSVVFTNSRSNYFITLINAATGATVKVFSAGLLKVHSTQQKRSFTTFNRLVQHLLVYLKHKQIICVKAFYFKFSYLAPRIKLSSFTFKYIEKLFRDHKIRVKRWILNSLMPHSAGNRLPKLRRK